MTMMLRLIIICNDDNNNDDNVNDDYDDVGNNYDGDSNNEDNNNKTDNFPTNHSFVRSFVCPHSQNDVYDTTGTAGNCKFT
jgi:hypothetical protein